MAQQQQQQSRDGSNANFSHGISMSTQQQQQQQKEVKVGAMFHDFLGMKPGSSSISNNNNDSNSKNNNEASAILASSRNPDASPSASQSLGASSAGAGVSIPGGRGGGGLLSTASDLASERQVPSHLEGIPYYVPRSDHSVAGSKRSNSDSTFTARDGVPQIIGHDSESLHLMKMLRKAGPGEIPKRSADDDQGLFHVQSTKPSSASLILQPSTPGGRLDPNKWERSPVQYPPRGSHYVPFTHQLNASRLGGEATAAGPSSISQAAAADEGSRTGIKGSGLLSSINAGSGNSERNYTGVKASGSKPRPGIHILEAEASTPSSRQDLASASRQMTIFYGGQAHVFDDVHPNKADVIMALAGSNGMSWSTTNTPKAALTTRPTGGGETSMGSGGEYDAGNAGINAALLERELRRRLPVANSPIPAGVPSSDRMIIRPTGGHHHGGGSSIVLGGGRETRNQDRNVQGSAEERRDV
ncbi:unnamed protein product [Linum tenue]|uniref:Protein TIFY n=1 Tax=Linum tenue TaxID=586396 RepID=A0AAV0K762_9ROSI|nr:unnamed protein product [Linum tenue]